MLIPCHENMPSLRRLPSSQDMRISFGLAMRRRPDQAAPKMKRRPEDRRFPCLGQAPPCHTQPCVASRRPRFALLFGRFSLPNVVSNLKPARNHKAPIRTLARRPKVT